MNVSTIHRRRGFTLVEVLVSMGIVAIGILALASARSKSINYTTISRNFALATNLANSKLDLCYAIPRYLMMFCDPAGAQCAAGQDPKTNGCCMVDPTTLGVCNTCAGIEKHIECAADGTPNATYSPQESAYYPFRRRTVVSTSKGQLLQVDVSVCFTRPGSEAAAEVLLGATPPTDATLWSNSDISICVKQSMLRTIN